MQWLQVMPLFGGLVFEGCAGVGGCTIAAVARLLSALQAVWFCHLAVCVCEVTHCAASRILGVSSMMISRRRWAALLCA